MLGCFEGYGDCPVYDQQRAGWFFFVEDREFGPFESADLAQAAWVRIHTA